MATSPQARELRQTEEVPLSRKLAALRDPAAHAPHPGGVDAVETHMAWVFLTGERALKLKKPVRGRRFDFSTIAARRRDAEREVALNRPLAGRIYRGVVPLSLGAGGALVVGGPGPVADWLVSMQRLPSRETLSSRLSRGGLRRAQLERAIRWLARFYSTVEPEPITERAYRDKLAAQIGETRADLLRERFEMPRDRVREAADRQLEVLHGAPDLFGVRARAGAIVDAHGDLRPEHVFLRPAPVFIDCLEFSRDLRLLDPVSELAFLGLECERAGAPRVAGVAFATYRKQTGDRPPERLIAFYRAHHALTRAGVAIWHLEDDPADSRRFRDKALRYLDMALAFHPRPRRYGPMRAATASRR